MALLQSWCISYANPDHGSTNILRYPELLFSILHTLGSDCASRVLYYLLYQPIINALHKDACVLYHSVIVLMVCSNTSNCRLKLHTLLRYTILSKELKLHTNYALGKRFQFLFWIPAWTIYCWIRGVAQPLSESLKNH